MHNLLKGLWRLFQPFKKYGVFKLHRIMWEYIKYFNSLFKYKKMGGKIRFLYLAPFLNIDNANKQSGGGHYFYQDIWALRKIASIKPAKHYDIGSRYDGFVGQCTAICPVVAIDIRPVNFKLSNLVFQEGNILKLPFKDNTINSLSCLHAIEHIGLGRYGDALDPLGSDKAMLELMRVLSTNGNLLISFPIGKERTEFNAQRVIHPLKPIEILTQLKIIEFSVVDDEDNFIENTSPNKYLNAKLACGLYHFVKI